MANQYTVEDYREAAKRARDAGNMEAAEELAQRGLALQKQGGGSNTQEQPEIPEGMVFDPNTGGYVDTTLPHNRVLGGGAGALVSGGAQGLGFGLSDEFVGALYGAFGPNSFSEDYEYGRDRIRGELDAARDQNPVAAYGSEITGAIASPTAMTSRAVMQGGPMARAAKGAGVAALEGGAYGFGASEGGGDERMEDAAQTGALAALIGGAAPAVSSLAGRGVKAARGRAATSKAVRGAPSSDELAKIASERFARADRVSGLDRGVLAQSTPKAIEKAERMGMDEILTPQASRAADRMVRAASDETPTIGFRDLDILRRQAQVPASNIANRIESSIGTGLVKNIDDVIEKSSKTLGDDVAEARKIWGRLRRDEIIQEAINKAENQASGFENGLRSQFRSILNSPSKRKGLSVEELKAIEKVVRGTRTTNALKKVGKLGIGLNQQSNALLASLGAAGGAAVGGPAMGIAVPAIGTAAQKIAERGTRKAATAAEGLVRAGGSAPVRAMSESQKQVIEDIMRRLARPSAGMAGQ